jgi:murein DD-endopeptidase MepM/ murein hydrolase activator NlpD
MKTRCFTALLITILLFAQITATALAQTKDFAAPSFIWPVEAFTAVNEPDASSNHQGITILGAANAAVYAAADGIVVAAEAVPVGYGNYLIIDHGDGYQTLYAHCASLEAECGDEVKSGQMIAAIGRSGRASSYQLHFEASLDGEIIDPLDYVTVPKE